MKLLTVLAATAVAAAIAAAISLPAGADPSAGDGATKLATCLHAHGVTGAPSGTDPLALKKWIGSHAGDPAVVDTGCRDLRHGRPVAVGIAVR